MTKSGGKQQIKDWKNIDTSEKVSLIKPIFEGVMFVIGFVGVIILLCFASEIKTAIFG